MNLCYVGIDFGFHDMEHYVEQDILLQFVITESAYAEFREAVQAQQGQGARSQDD